MELNYTEWMAQVTSEVKRLSGYSPDDFEEFPFLDAYNQNVTPGEAAVQLLHREGIETREHRLTRPGNTD